MVILEDSNRIKNIENKFNASIKDLLYQMHWSEDMKHRDIGSLLNVPRPTITKWFRRFEVPTQSCRRFTDKNLTSWLYKIGKLKKKPRYEGPDRRVQRTKGGLNVDFFKKWSSEMAYVLGYFCADGGMFINSGGSKYIHFVSTDLELLEKIKCVLKSKHKIALKRKGNGNWKNTFLLQIGSKEIYDDLVKLGLSPNKEYRLKLPNMPNKYLRHFVRGYFDGDGCISYNHFFKLKNRNNKFVHQQVIFAAANKDFVSVLANKLSKVASLTHPCLKSARDRNSHYLTYYRKDEILKVFKFMYDNVLPSLYLTRKYNKFIKWKYLNGDVV